MLKISEVARKPARCDPLRRIAATCAVFCWVCGGAFGMAWGTASAEDAREARLERELAELKARLHALEKGLGVEPQPGEENLDPSDPAGLSQDAELEAATGDAAGFTPFYERGPLETPRALRTVYDKPFLASVWRRAHVGGYTEFEFHEFEDAVLGIPEGFRMHRTNLFFFAEVSDRVRFGSEIEFETEFEPTGPSNNIETKVEMAFVDWVLFEELKLRAGSLLVPLGRINVNHDGPVRELTDRPLISTFVIPTTLTEAGAGIHGTFSLPRHVSLSYEAYAVNGFSALNKNGELASTITRRESVLRDARSSNGGDINSGVATTGRVAAQVSELLEVGGSWHVGTYDENGDNFLRIFAGDIALTHDWRGAELVLEGEVAIADFQRDAFARTAGVPDSFWGYYVQGSIGAMPSMLRQLAPGVFDEEGAQFSLVLRYDWVDLDGDEGAAIEPGLTFRPVADTVFKLSYRFAQKSIGSGGPGIADDDDGVVMAVSTYF